MKGRVVIITTDSSGDQTLGVDIGINRPHILPTDQSQLDMRDLKPGATVQIRTDRATGDALIDDPQKVRGGGVERGG